MNYKILVADDEPDVLALVTSNLCMAGFEVVQVDDGLAVIPAVAAHCPNLVVIDLMLPGMSGLDICRALRANPSTTEIPIIMLTAKAEEVDRIVGLEMGTDDYITKPFSPRELVLRVKNVLKRTEIQEVNSDCLTVGEIILDKARLRVTVAGRLIDFTATEITLLRVLLERRGFVQSRNTLLNDVWGYNNVIDTRTVDTHVRRLREKLDSAADCIETVRGFGYRIK